MRRSKFGRLVVWDNGKDPYKHSDLGYNWDVLDAMIGGPEARNAPDRLVPSVGELGASRWLGPGETGSRTLYSVVQGLVSNDVPLGTVVSWWRPNTTVALPTGWVPADGSTYTSSQHSYGPLVSLDGNITVPDLRNKFVLGAYETDTNVASVGGIGRDGLAGSAADDSATAGPGIRGSAGTHRVGALTHGHTPGSLLAASHDHGFDHVHTGGRHYHSIPAHVHGMDHVHMEDHFHQSTTGGAFQVVSAGGASSLWFPYAFGIDGAGKTITSSPTGGGIYGTASAPDGAFGLAAHARAVTSPAVASRTDTGAGFAGRGNTDAISLTTNTGAGGEGDVATSSPIGSGKTGVSGTLALSGTSATSLAGDARPGYVGLLYIVKIKVAGPLT